MILTTLQQLLPPAPYRHLLRLGTIAAAMFLFGCTKTIIVTIPSRVDLKAYNTIGIVEFASTCSTPLNREVTQSFLEWTQAAQPGFRLLELGSEEQLLQGIGRKELDPTALKLIGEKYRVDAVLTGLLDVSEVKPNLQISTNLASALSSGNASAKAYVTGVLSVKLRETSSGVTLWGNSGHGKWTLASMGLNSDKQINFGMSNKQEKYSQMIRDLVRVVTADFRPTYEKRKVEKDH